jgi:uncharacterized phage-associated protein
MEKLNHVAKNLYDMYFATHGVPMDEMKMHKLMYFAQRESLMLYNEPLFDGTFYGWKFGPVLREVRAEYHENKRPYHYTHNEVSTNTKSLLENVMKRYGNLSSWKLSSLSHAEFSWKHSRRGLMTGENGDKPLLLDAMKVDALREASERKTMGE